MAQKPQGSGIMPKNDGEILIEQYNQVTESIKSVFDLTSRIDERVKTLVERQNDADERHDKVLDIQQQIINRITTLEAKCLEMKEFSSVRTEIHEINKKVAIMESSVDKADIDDIKQKIHTLDLRVEAINMRTANQEGRWAKLFDLAFKLTIMLIGGYLLFKFGWQAPP